MTTPVITACICTYNRYDLLPKAIASLVSQDLPADRFRIVVVDNSPDPERSAREADVVAGIGNLAWHYESTPGLSNARNVGTRMCETPLIAFMDDDAIASPGWLDRLVSTFDRFGPDVAVAGGRVDPVWDVPRPNWIHKEMQGYISIVDWGGAARIAEPREWLAGTNIAFRTEVVLRAGGFDTGLGRTGGGATLLSNEEMRMLHWIREAGMTSAYVPEAVVRHLVDRRRLTHSWFRKRVAWQAVSDLLMDADATIARADREWHKVLDYFWELPPRLRNLAGLSMETDDPVLFRKQLLALELVTIRSLNGFAGINVP